MSDTNLAEEFCKKSLVKIYTRNTMSKYVNLRSDKWLACYCQTREKIRGEVFDGPETFSVDATEV